MGQGNTSKDPVTDVTAGRTPDREFGAALSPAFAVDVTKYYVWLPNEAETVTVGATTEDSKASWVLGWALAWVLVW